MRQEEIRRVSAAPPLLTADDRAAYEEQQEAAGFPYPDDVPIREWMGIERGVLLESIDGP